MYIEKSVFKYFAKTTKLKEKFTNFCIMKKPVAKTHKYLQFQKLYWWQRRALTLRHLCKCNGRAMAHSSAFVGCDNISIAVFIGIARTRLIEIEQRKWYMSVRLWYFLFGYHIYLITYKLLNYQWSDYE